MLSLKGLRALRCNVTLSVRGRRAANGEFDWKNAVMDALLISGGTFFAGLGALAAQGISLEGFVVLVSATGLEFVSVLAVKRNLTA